MTKKRSSEMLAYENREMFQEKVKSGEFSTEIGGKSETGAEMHHCHRLGWMPLYPPIPCQSTKTFIHLSTHPPTHLFAHPPNNTLIQTIIRCQQFIYQREMKKRRHALIF